MGFELVAPESVEEAVGVLADARPGEVVVLAGGTDLLLDVDDGRLSPRTVLSLRRVPWRTSAWHGASFSVGSTLPIRRLELDPTVRARLPGLYEAVRAVGGVALRHRATLGGNLGRASPASDLIPILLAYEARVRLVGPTGGRTARVSEFVKGSRSTDLGRGELIESITIPTAAPSAYVWQRVRPANDISQVGVAVARSAESPTWRVALGGVQPVPVRLPSVEKILSGDVPSDAELERAALEAARAAPFVTDKRATEPYRRRLVTTLVRRAVRTTIARGGGKEMP